MASRENPPCSLAAHLRQTAFWIDQAHAPASFPAPPARASCPGRRRGSAEPRSGCGRCVLGAGPARRANERLWIRRSRRLRGRTRSSEQRGPPAPPGSPGLPAASRSPATLTRLLGTVPISHVLPSDPGESEPSLRTPPRSLEDKAEGS